MHFEIHLRVQCHIILISNHSLEFSKTLINPMKDNDVKYSFLSTTFDFVIDKLEISRRSISYYNSLHENSKWVLKADVAAGVNFDPLLPQFCNLMGELGNIL